MIDLHSHTDQSDGSLKPKELVDLAAKVGLEALAITDHDTFSGYEQALPWAQELGLDLVRGIELNSRVELDRESSGKYAHILGYFPNRIPSIDFMLWLNEMRLERTNRNERLITSLQAAGVNITLAEVEARGRSLTGRPHFARVLVDKGYATSFQDAFRRYLGEDAASYVQRESLTARQIVEKVRVGGGVPVLAHAVRLGMEQASERQFLQDLQAAGLLGLEVYHSEHSASLQAYYLQLAGELKLLPTGGSDFHGPDVKPDINLGTGRSRNVRVPMAFLERVREAAAHL